MSTVYGNNVMSLRDMVIAFAKIGLHFKIQEVEQLRKWFVTKGSDIFAFMSEMNINYVLQRMTKDYLEWDEIDSYNQPSLKLCGRFLKMFTKLQIHTGKEKEELAEYISSIID